MKTKLTIIFLLLVFVTPATLRAETPPTTSPQASSEKGSGTQEPDPVASQVSTYDQLVAAIRKTKAESQLRLEEAYSREKVRECWEIGKLIDEHVLQHKERADYGKQVIIRLAADLGMSESELYRMLEFYRAYPKAVPAGKLVWTAYEALLTINDAKERAEVEALANQNGWNRDQIRDEIKRRGGGAASDVFAEEKLTAKPGKPGTYKMVKMQEGGRRMEDGGKNGATSQGPRGTGKAGNKGGPEMGELVIDLGFSNYYRTSRPLGFKEGAIIEALFAMPEGSSPSDKIKLSKRAADDLYTYRASIIEVLDGDTVNAVVDLGFGVRSVQTLRLRGIDAPEIVSKEGKEAKAALEQMLQVQDGGGRMADGEKDKSADGEEQKPGSVERGANSKAVTSVLIKTVKSDKYDRYLADVFVDKVYVNQKLVESGYAVRVRDS